MTCKAAVLVNIPGWNTLNDRDELVEKVRETAYPQPGANNRDLLITWQEEDLWKLRGLVESTIDAVESGGYGILFPDRDEAVNGETNSNLAVFSWWVEP